MKTPSQILFHALFRVNSPSKEDRERVARNVVAYLDDKWNRSFQYSDKSLKPIMAILAEGYNQEACKTVIDICTKMWLNKKWVDKDGNIKNGNDYLRPSTVFGNGKFTEKLNKKYEDSWDDLINCPHIPNNPQTIQLLKEYGSKLVS